MSVERIDIHNEYNLSDHPIVLSSIHTRKTQNDVKTQID